MPAAPCPRNHELRKTWYAQYAASAGDLVAAEICAGVTDDGDTLAISLEDLSGDDRLYAPERSLRSCAAARCGGGGWRRRGSSQRGALTAPSCPCPGGRICRVACSNTV